jgi:hypothetical protein
MTGTSAMAINVRVVPHEVLKHYVNLAETQKEDAKGMVFELYRDGVLTSYQPNEILLAMGCTTIRNTGGKLIGYR